MTETVSNAPTKRATKSKKVSRKKVSKKTSAKKEEPVKNEIGRYPNIEYVYDEYGFINWRKTIPQRFLLVNQGWFHNLKKDAPKSVEDLSDDQIIIRLGGLKWVAKIHGYQVIDYEIVRSEDGYCVTKCTIDWGADSPTTSEVASATDFNCDGFGKSFLESISANRAFSRCVRNFLNINIVSDEELGPLKEDSSNESPNEKKGSTKSSSSSAPSSIVPQEFFLKSAKDKLGSLESVIWFLKEQEIDVPEDAEESKILEILDVKTSRSLIKKLNQSKKI